MGTQQSQLNLSDPVRRQVTAFASRVKQMAPDAIVILFGSQAAGAAQPGSDIDLCVVSRFLSRDYHKETVTLLSIAHEFPIPMDVIPYSPEDLANKYDPLAKEVRMRGIHV